MTPTPNDRLNFLIVGGLFVIALSTVVAISAIYVQTHTVQPELVLLVSSIASGMVGFLSREYKPGQGGSNVDAPNAAQVTVNQPSAPAMPPEENKES